MGEIPDKTPLNEQGKTSPGFARRLTVVEWIVIVCIALVIGALCLPDVDDSVQKARQRMREKKAAQGGP